MSDDDDDDNNDDAAVVLLSLLLLLLLLLLLHKCGQKQLRQSMEAVAQTKATPAPHTLLLPVVAT